ncbi:ATP-binding protein [Thalassospira sp. TSL5-1]|uniref:GAF domain-containing sensor histidine kinase n=1 Tax=Thalassospira sp. TSL5-1 TaxID=1544451 RepID=UPI00093B4DE7|nr:ATP-binding protein [Thalassospira sp. TSL5-1]OKH89090.1 histidine kinase [Thalassospira sp. TSL5-1]
MSELAHYLRISNLLAGNLDISSALHSVKSEIEKIIEFDHLDVCLIDEDKTWNTSYEIGLQTSWSTSRSAVRLSPVRDILYGKTDHLLTGNALKDPRYIFPDAVSAPILHHEFRSRVNVAMKVLGEVIGSLNCSSKKENFYDESHVEQVRILADILAPYFYALRANEKAQKEAIFRAEILAREEGLRLGALSLTDALEAERQRIGMDLHDQTLADLTRIARDIRPGLTDAQHHNLQQQIQNMIQDLRGIIDTSIPSILELFGFHHAIVTHLERAISPESPVRFSVDDLTNGAVDALPETIRIAIFRICQEAINNAVLHSGAHHIGVGVNTDDQHNLTITIADNGTFNTARRKPGGGLAHIKTRARLIGADYHIRTENGTQITLKLPNADQNTRKSGDENTAG